jgi:diguanylate cyclase (GGDEF)-like protein
MLDISDEMTAQEALRANEQLLRRLTETLPLGVLQIDAARRVVYQNSRVAVAMGAAVGETLGEAHLRSTLPGDRPAVEAALDAVLRGDGDVDLEYGYHNPETGVRRIHANLRALTADSGEVTGAIICLTDVTEDRRLRDDLRRQATYDALTGCHNRASTLIALQDCLDHPGTRGTAVMFLDLNGFKGVNDRLGHATGDRLLRLVADRLRSTVRDSDVVGRFGGDEFVVVCHDVAGAGAARRIAESVVAALDEASLDVAGDAVRPAASIGLAWAAAGPAAAESLIARADAAMYEAKRTRAGRLHLVLADA